MSVEFQYQCYVITKQPEKVERALLNLKEVSQESFEVDWATDGETINFMVIGSSTDIVEKWAAFFSDQKEHLSNSEEYVLWCYCDHDDLGLPVLAKIGGKTFVGNYKLKEYFGLRKEIVENKFNDHTREIGKRLLNGQVKLGKIKDTRLRDEYGLL